MARLDFTDGNVLTDEELNELARQVIADVTSTSKPTGTAEGETIAVRDSDRQELWDGSKWVRGVHWAPEGRTWVLAQGQYGGLLGSGIEYPVSWDPITDPDGFYIGFSETDFYFQVPALLGGIYSIFVYFEWFDSWTPAGGDWVRILTSAGAFEFPQQPANGKYVAGISGASLAGGSNVAVRFKQTSGASQNVGGVNFTMVRWAL